MSPLEEVAMTTSAVSIATGPEVRDGSPTADGNEGKKFGLFHGKGDKMSASLPG